ncbi:MAG: ATP-binding cassette domain-containing protein [Candidatus Nitrosocosmicus sp.]|nr:ATP-binding cassette domain-containing protein [Candidatus Nitrosocosmicus sp.]MDN5868332.1 ATP-binding cassette domain-containing protein [Candidatus Nitrosocosmicus sp.]
MYGSQTAVDQINLQIKSGSIFGLLGPNGAGKTTVIKMLTGLSKPTQGKALVAGYDVTTHSLKVKENIGWISSEVILDDSLTIMENIWIQSRLHSLNSTWKKKAIGLLKYLELDEKDNKRVGKFSTGMKKKLEIIMALLHDPKVLFMDEPTIGLDVNSRRLLWRLIKKINTQYGVTILLTTHYIEEADVLCDDIAIINNGKIVASGSPQQLKSGANVDIVEIDFFSYFDYKVLEAVSGILEIIEVGLENSGREKRMPSDRSLRLRIKVGIAETILPELISKISEFGPALIKSIKIEKPNLESAFLELTGKRFEEIEEAAYDQK